MEILHYSLGLPPYRSGGLTKYSIDLMTTQVEKEDNVYLLFPGRINKKCTYIKKYNKYKGIEVYELINPLPVPLLDGVKNPLEYMRKCDKDIFIKFLAKLKIKIVHIHTLMGLHIEFLDACKYLGIKIVFTTHDYYGICTKVNFVDQNSFLCKERCINKCVHCNYNGNSLKKISILQSQLYRGLKNIGMIKLLKTINKKSIYKNERFKEILIQEENEIDSFKELLNYYNKFYEKIDFFLFNSDITKCVYDKYLKVNGKVINITHRDIADKRKKRNYEGKELRLLYMGSLSSYKGADILLETLEELKNKDIKLFVYGDIGYKNKSYENVIFEGFYKTNEMENIFAKSDLLIVPSICYETFGFVTLEAISNGVPVIVTETVGSKRLINLKNPKGKVINGNKNELKKEILKIYHNKYILAEYNKNICDGKFKYSINDHYLEINQIYEMVSK